VAKVRRAGARATSARQEQALRDARAPGVECVGTGKARKPCEFRVKNAMVISQNHGLMPGARSFPGNPYDGQL